MLKVKFKLRLTEKDEKLGINADLDLDRWAGIKTEITIGKFKELPLSFQ